MRGYQRPAPFWSSKGSNGGVAVGLPHRNYSVFKQADLNKRLVKVRIRMDPRFSARVTYRRGIEGSK